MPDARTGPTGLGSWHPTAAHARATVLGLVGVVIGAVVRRPDLVVLSAPLLIAALWGVVTRPQKAATVVTTPTPDTVREGGTTDVVTSFETPPGTESVAVVLPRGSHTAYDPPSATGLADGSVGSVRLLLRCRALRWGRHALGPAFVTASSTCGAYRCQHMYEADLPITCLPVPDVFDRRAPLPHPMGLVGANRSVRSGEGTELGDIRPFRIGDRIRRVHWPVSLRTGELHVTTTHADQDAEIHLVLDAVTDIGPSEGLGGRSSSLDNAVRAAGALAEHFLGSGERVGLTVIGSRRTANLRPAGGRRHLRRILDTLARIEPDDGTVASARAIRSGLRQDRVSAGAIVVVLTPVASPDVLGHAVALGRRGLPVVVVDTLPAALARGGPGPAPDEEWGSWLPGGPPSIGTTTPQLREQARLAWRLRLLERDLELRRTREVGVPITPWRGPGTLDLVLRQLSRRSRAPRVAAR